MVISVDKLLPIRVDRVSFRLEERLGYILDLTHQLLPLLRYPEQITDRKVPVYIYSSRRKPKYQLSSDLTAQKTYPGIMRHPC